MKFLPTFLALLLFAASIDRLAAANLEGTPDTIDYQGRVLDQNGKPLGIDPATDAPKPTNYNVQFRIFDQLSGGTLLWSETQLVTVSSGQFSVRIGQGTTIPTDTIATPRTLKAVFEGKSRYLEVTVIPLGASSAGPISPRLAFLSSPFAIVAERAKEADHAAAADLATVAGSVNQTGSGATSKLGRTTVEEAIVSGGLRVDGSITGNGQNIRELDAAKMTLGTLADSRLSSNVALKNGANVFNGANTFSGSNTFSSSQNTFFGNGQNLTLNASNLTAGTVADSRLSDQIIKNYALNAKILYVKGVNDDNHVLRNGVGTPWNIDGTVLTGFQGGILGTSNTALGLKVPILSWGNDDVTVNRQFFIRDTSKNFPGRWRLFQAQIAHMGGKGDEFRFQYVRDGDPLPTDVESQKGTYFFIQSDGSTGKTSDRRLKKDISPLGSTLESVLKLRPIQYRATNQDASAPLVPGYLAQDVQPLFPEVVSERDGYLGLSYEGIAVYATRALQELAAETRAKAAAADAEIARLAEENRALRGDVGDLQRRLDALEARLK